MLVTGCDSSEHILDGEGPPDLGTTESNHSNFFLDPLDSVGFGIVEDGFLQDGLKGRLHLIINLVHPVLYFTFHLYGVNELVVLTLIRVHTDHLLFTLPFKFLAVIEKTEHISLNLFWVGVTQDGEKIFVGDEIESWEAHLLGFKIVGQTLLALVEFK